MRHFAAAWRSMRSHAWLWAILGAMSLTSGALRAAQFDLHSLPAYRAHKPLSGTIRMFGSTLSGMVKVWEKGFRRFQPGIRFENRFPSGDAGIAGLVSGVADIAPQAREQTLIEHLMFFESYGYPASSVTVASGGYDAEGMADGLVIFVQKNNPISRLTLRQLDDIFGAQRTGALHGFEWSMRRARSAQEDIRTWGQLGLRGKWSAHPIQTYGYAPTGMSHFFRINVLHGSDKWNPNYREYVESGTKMIGRDGRAVAGGLHYMLSHELAHDPYGIAYGVLSQAKGVAGVKVVALARHRGGPYVLPSRRSFQDRSYPLSRNIYMYFRHPPGTRLDPLVREFLRYVVSRQGQEAVQRASRYLPLSAALARKQLEKLN